MRSLALIPPLFVSLAAAGVAIGPLPAPDYADTEVSTNFAFSVGEGLNRGIVFTVEIHATPSNNVEIAIGVDADEDGRLSVDESELCVGCDCGTWFVRSAQDDTVTTTDAVIRLWGATTIGS